MLLLLTGIASSYFFNEDIRLSVRAPDSDDSEHPRMVMKHLRGVNKRSNIGYLTITEHIATSEAESKKNEMDAKKEQLLQQMQFAKVCFRFYLKFYFSIYICCWKHHRFQTKRLF